MFLSLETRHGEGMGKVAKPGIIWSATDHPLRDVSRNEDIIFPVRSISLGLVSHDALGISFFFSNS
jgi:hypothetical protein